MTDAEIFGKLSRIFETHGFSHEDEEDLEDFLEDFEISNFAATGGNMGGRSVDFQAQPYGNSGMSPTRGGSARPTPYQVWQDKNKKKFAWAEPRPAPKLSGEQWDRLVDKMHLSNRAKQSAMIKEQNQGLALELGGYLFKPRLNKTSLDLSSTMKSLHLRMDEMIAERKKDLEVKKKESEDAEVAECTFSPHRLGKKMSDKYLAKLGRKKVTPDDLIKYEEEKKKRIEMRKHIVQEVESKELTFRPQLGEKSLKLQEKLVKEGVLHRDPLTRTAKAPATGNAKGTSFRGTNVENVGNDARYEQGPMLVIESEHPYRHNTNEFTTVQIPGAVSYTITFHEDTKTEAIHDYVKFYDDETHTYHFGCGKYSGGTNGSSYNWPGLDGRPSLVIPSPKFIINFRTNGGINDWGFRIHIVPTLLVNNNHHDSNAPFETLSLTTPAIPNISDAGKNIRNQERVHDRLYKHGVLKHAEVHNTMVDLMQNKLNISLKPWETSRAVNALQGDTLGESTPAHPYVQKYSKTHLPKSTIADVIKDLMVPDGDGSVAGSIVSTASRNPAKNQNVSLVKIGSKYASVIEFDDSLNSLWRQLRTL